MFAVPAAAAELSVVVWLVYVGVRRPYASLRT